MQPLIGVLGGIGPLATVDLMHKIIEETHAERDQDHVSMVIWNIRKRWINRRHWLEAVPHRYRPCWKELPL